MRNERGGSRIALIFWLLVLGAAVFAALRIVPLKVAVMELHDFADSEVQAAAMSSRFDEKTLVEKVLAKARTLDLPLDKTQVKVEKIGNELNVRLQHEVVVNLEVQQWTWAYDKTFTHNRF